MDFWVSFWATTWGALAGGGFGALVAWLFALDVRRRDARDRMAAQSARMRLQWGRVAPLFREHAEALERLPPPYPFDVAVRFRLRHARRTLRELNRALIETAGMGDGEDMRLVDALGRAANAHLREGPVDTRALRVAWERLMTLAVTGPDRLPEERTRVLQAVVEATADLDVNRATD